MAKSKFNAKDLSFTMDGKFYYGWVMLIVSFMCMFIAYVIKANCSALFYTPICEEFGVTRTVYAQTNTVMTVCMLVSSAFIGKIFSKNKLRFVMPILIAIICLTYIGMSRATGMGMLLFMSAIQGFCWAGATNLPVNVMVSNWFGPKVKGTMMSIGMLGSGAGALVWVPMMKNVMAANGWRATYVRMAEVLAIMIPVTLIFCVNRPDEKGFTRRIGDLSPDEVKATGGVAMDKRGVPANEVLKLPSWWCQFLAHVLTMVCASAMTTQCVAYFTDLGVEDGAKIYASALGTLIFGKFIVGAISDVISIKRVAIITPLFYTIVFVCLALCSTNMGFKNGVIWAYMIGGALPSVVPALITVHNFGDKEYSVMAGWMNMAGNIGQIIGPILAAAVFDIMGSYVAAWIAFAVLMVVVSVLYFLSSHFARRDAKKFGYDPELA